ncbi:tyrosine-protein kinase family protein [Beggiatoa alba]|nr:tyrosine-protein kinase family protein [Beggiatoa alba]
MSSIEKAVERLNKSNGPQKNSVAHVKHSPQIIKEEGEIQNNNVKKGIICHLNLAELEKQGFLTPESDRSKFAEEYRLLKRPLLMNAKGKGTKTIDRGNLIMVVSALPGEGKTFTALNLGLSLAMERDTTVLVVDSDVVNPSLTRLLGLQNEPGLIDVLLNEQIGLGDVIVNTDIPKLSVMPAGQTHVNSTELLASEQMQRVANELSVRYPDRIVIFDAPPLLVTTEAGVLAHVMGQVLMVVEAGKTPQHVIIEAITKLEEDKVIGLVLNKSRVSSSGDYYGGYGGYGHQ